MQLNPDNVPPECRPLIALAEKWNIGDDFLREDAVTAASSHELHELVQRIVNMPGEELFDWLAGPESFDTSPSEEYLAFTHLVMAYDSARLKLSR